MAGRLNLVRGLIAVPLLVGCQQSSSVPAPPAHPYQGVTLSVGVAEGRPELDSLVTAIYAQRGEWESRHEAHVVPAARTADELAAPNSDLILFPADTLGDLLAAGSITPLPEGGTSAVETEGSSNEAPGAPPDQASFIDVLAAYRGDKDHVGVGRFGGTLQGLPVGASALVVVYRRDAFSSEDNQRAAAESGVKLEPPRTYSQLDDLARFFHGRDWNGDGRPESGISLPLGDDPDHLAEMLLLARAAALGLHPDQFGFLFDEETMAPLIALPPFVKALTGLAGLKACGPEAMENFDAEAARAAFRAGRTALLIDRAEMASRWTDPEHPMAVGVAPLPGSEAVFDPDRNTWQEVDPPNRPSYLPLGGGWLVGVSSSCTGKTRAAAVDYLQDVTGPETSARLIANRAFPMLPARSSLVGSGPRSAPGVDTRSWVQAVRQSLVGVRIAPMLRIPGTRGYLEDLATARRAVVGGAATAEVALRQAEQAWSERTRRLGTERQLWFYRRSLNRPTRDASPPPGPSPEQATQVQAHG